MAPRIVVENPPVAVCDMQLSGAALVTGTGVHTSGWHRALSAYKAALKKGSFGGVGYQGREPIPQI